jgi:hypothetical protein
MAKKPPRKVIVLASLMGVLTLTSAMLLALAPPPLSAESSLENLWVTDSAGSGELTDAVFKTRTAVKAGQWKYIFIHDSAAKVAGVVGAGDHFVVADGVNRPDGQIVMTQRWNAQNAARPPGVESIDPSCISICVCGDFDAARPTATQMRRLAELVSTLQGQLGIGGDKVYMLADAGAGAGVGKQFPREQLRQQILP